MNILVTGDNGFVGRHLKEAIYERNDNDQVIGFDYEDGDDLLDYEQLRAVLDIHRPNEIYHLAAQAFVPESFHNPNRTIDVNIKGTINLFEAVKNLGLETKILIACSSEEYGKVLSDEVPIKENNPLRPASPYAVTKVACDMLADWYTKQYGLHIVRTRAFNHTGPGRGEMYVESSFAKQIALIEKKGGVLKHGNLEALRDYTDVRDMVQAYMLAINLESDVYNIGSGKAIYIREVLEKLCVLSKTRIKFEEDRSRMRKTEVPILEADASKFVNLTGWSPKYSIDKTLSDLLDYWRERV